MTVTVERLFGNPEPRIQNPDLDKEIVQKCKMCISALPALPALNSSMIRTNLVLSLDKVRGGVIFRNMSNIREEDIMEYAEKFKALSNPNRLKIFLRLVTECCLVISDDELEGEVRDQGCACVGDIGKYLGIVPSTISHHLKELRQAGLIKMERRGQKMECWIDPKTVEAMGAFFSLGE